MAGLSNNDIGKYIIIVPQMSWGKVMVGKLVELGPTHHVCTNVVSIYKWSAKYEATKAEEEAMMEGWNENLQYRTYPKTREYELAHLNGHVSLWTDHGKLE